MLSYCGSYHFAPSGKPDRNAMAEALQSLSLFRGTGSGIGSGYELEKTPTRAEALIMLIRMLGEEKAALACTASQPFMDVAYPSYYALSVRTSGGAALSRKLIDAGVFTDADYRAAQALVKTARIA